nr:hypothetical protein [Companilactobacillus mishanensis]
MKTSIPNPATKTPIEVKIAELVVLPVCGNILFAAEPVVPVAPVPEPLVDPDGQPEVEP